MLKENELYAAGGTFVHPIFGKGVVPDADRSSDPGKGHHPFGTFLDGKATEVFWPGRKLGYVPRNHHVDLSHLLDGGERIDVVVKGIVERQGEPLAFKVAVWV